MCSTLTLFIDHIQCAFLRLSIIAYYIRPHDALSVETPSEKCGIKIDGKNKWFTIIQNASKW
jgi:hypothetical protein